MNYSQPGTLARHVPANPMTEAARLGAPQMAFGLVHGQSSRSITLLPAIRDLLYRADRVTIEGSAWMTWTEGLY